MALLSSLKQIAGIESGSMCKEFMPEFFKLVLGTISLPINLPYTNYGSGVQVNYMPRSMKNLYTFDYIIYTITKIFTGKAEHSQHAKTTYRGEKSFPEKKK